MYSLLQPILYSFDPEQIHEWTLGLCRRAEKIPGFMGLIGSMFSFDDPRLAVSIGNLTFANPVGLAAGFDKNGIAVPWLHALGFGHVEVGTVTPKPQPGNPKQRLFRLREDLAVINRMGFNNDGVEALVRSLQGINRQAPVGINLGKNKDTPMEEAAQDYVKGLKAAWELADYFTINISSPNTQNLRSLQQEEFLYPFIREIIQTRDQLVEQRGSYRQVWLKIAPDLTDQELEIICGIVLDLKVDALVVTNTTISRPGLQSPQREEMGGLSGKPVFELSNQVLSEVARLTQGQIPLIGVGGIFSAQDAFHKLSLGASLVQVLTGLIYQGPGLVRSINKGLVGKLNKNKLSTITQLTGSAFELQQT
ncbi:MAG: dihydroorotate dehydrogenase (quinone) [SAR324 cluster bacterium]|uniref:Dihydroorotate dehydrogenase (quinone) n=1 Tax=SAR324 cluster bacterium TaxID=2024889 RepID=A0A2A4T7D2_9DELT|nr:MAG: dihydroorotate dehydrogenase (quinone) [SAR324 cluster bacterium]